MSEYVVKGAEPNETVLHTRTKNGFEEWMWLPVREEIVRCRDCAKWSFFDIEDGKRIGDCSEWTHLDGFSHATDENGFCAWGERK